MESDLWSGIRRWCHLLIPCLSPLPPSQQLGQHVNDGLDVLGLEQESDQGENQQNCDGSSPAMALELAENPWLEFGPTRGQGGDSRS